MTVNFFRKKLAFCIKNRITVSYKMLDFSKVRLVKVVKSGQKFGVYDSWARDYNLHNLLVIITGVVCSTIYHVEKILQIRTENPANMKVNYCA